ncbi:hypothetical protein HD599_000400 [Conyzicola lurida]|uniref:LytR/CpsA/Psr regulator C-terminal domain-containing protein n=1 Tax=Conyzicola lurida TaxID=1172621 RepID=A0A841AFQ9_9MICO|nr:LytR C-terminal domain-containing protein [Conyzicola lurida]MBB5842077.1 hypothetical protein [Conyzicola lurida]
MASYPKDRFDDLPKDLVRVGAHRAPKKRGGGWIGFAWAALATLVLIVGGLFTLSLVDPSIRFEFPGLPAASEPSATPTDATTPTALPLTDPALIDPARGITITVLNGSTVVGQQDVAGAALTSLGWPVGSLTTASTSDIEETIVYYSNPADEEIARGLVQALGVGDVRESTAFVGAPITIVLGADYAPTP